MAFTTPSTNELIGMISLQETSRQLEEYGRAESYLNNWGRKYAEGSLDKDKRDTVRKNLDEIRLRFNISTDPRGQQFANDATNMLDAGAPGITLGGAAKFGAGLVGTGAVMAASPYLLRGIWHTGAPQRAVGAVKGVHDLLRGKGGTLGEAWEAGKQPYKERFRAWRAGGTQAATEAAETAMELPQRLAKVAKEGSYIPASIDDDVGRSLKPILNKLKLGLKRQTDIVAAGSDIKKLEAAMAKLSDSTKNTVRHAVTEDFKRRGALSKTTKGLAKWASRGGAAGSALFPGFPADLAEGQPGEPGYIGGMSEKYSDYLRDSALILKLVEDLREKAGQRKESFTRAGRIPFPR